MIRLANIDDISACTNLAKSIYGNFMLSNGIEMIDADLRSTVEFFIKSNQILVVDQKGVCGMVAWMVSPHPANFRCKIFQEVLWACNSKFKTDALLLLRALDRKANECGADVMLLANLSLDNEPAIRRIYAKLGYSYLESHYSRKRI